MKKILAALTVPIPFVVLWLGCWLMRDLKYDSWQMIPAGVTAIVLFGSAIFGAMAANILAWSEE